jgi:ABC-type Zn uptake system ZnuABC Zn-binding protein ZnuA
MQVADLIISNGSAAPYAKWLQTSSLPSERLIEAATRGLSLSDFISVEDIQIVHSHGPEGEHSHPTMVSRTWLGPKVLGKQAAFIEQQLSKRFPDQATAFGENLSALNIELDSVSGDLQPSETDATISVLSATPHRTNRTTHSIASRTWPSKSTIRLPAAITEPCLSICSTANFQTKIF